MAAQSGIAAEPSRALPALIKFGKLVLCEFSSLVELSGVLRVDIGMEVRRANASLTVDQLLDALPADVRPCWDKIGDSFIVRPFVNEVSGSPHADRAHLHALAAGRPTFFSACRALDDANFQVTSTTDINWFSDTVESQLVPDAAEYTAEAIARFMRSKGSQSKKPCKYSSVVDHRALKERQRAEWEAQKALLQDLKNAERQVHERMKKPQQDSHQCDSTCIQAPPPVARATAPLKSAFKKKPQPGPQSK